MWYYGCYTEVAPDAATTAVGEDGQPIEGAAPVKIGEDGQPIPAEAAAEPEPEVMRIFCLVAFLRELAKLIIISIS